MMKREDFIGWGIFSLTLVGAGFIATYLNYGLLGILFIAAGAASFWLIQRQAKKESWYGKKRVKRY